MRHCFLTGVVLLLLASCDPKEDPLFGRWTVEKVNVEFDEHKSNPEMVRQFGEMEKDNVIEITKDSLLFIISDGDTIQGKCLLIGNEFYQDGGLLYLDGNLRVSYHHGVLKEESFTPWGKLVVTYSKRDK